MGLARRDADGNYYIEGLDGYLWNGGFLRSDSPSQAAAINAWFPPE